MNANILIDKIENNMNKVFDEDTYKELLNIMGLFYNYSFNNQILITLQMPDAIKLAGYQEWAKLGREVSRGSRGIAILAPKSGNVYLDNKNNIRVRKSQITNGELKKAIELGIVKREKVRNGFIGVYVFDISQTKEISQSEFIKSKIDVNRLVIEQYGIDIIVKILESVTGVNIANEGTDELQKISAAIHKAGYELVDKISTGRKPCDKYNKTVKLDENTKEAIANSVEYAIMNYLGTDVSKVDLSHIIEWEKLYNTSEVVRGKLNNNLKYINEIVSKIISGINTICSKDGEYSGESDERIVREEMADDMLSILQARVLRDKLYL